MPVRTKRTRTAWTRGQIEQLLSGHDLFGDGFGDGNRLDLAAVAECWNDVQTELLPAFIEAFPGRRPWAWWLLVGVPEHGPRLQIGDGPRAEGPPDWFGAPSCFACVPLPGMYEGQTAFLDRRGLLSEAERAGLETPPGKSESEFVTEFLDTQP